MSCYRFLKVTDHDSDDILFELLDATYIIHLFNNGRYPSIMTQLTLYKPSKNTFIVVNKGYKKCTKDLPEQNSIYDIVDAYKNIFKHSLKMNFNNIMILEDDFIFDEEIKNPRHIDIISKFFTKYFEFFIVLLFILTKPLEII